MTKPAPDPDDDPQWLDLLAGRQVADPDRRTAQEAAWLRAALLAYRAQAPAGVPAAPAERVARLLARARASGLIPAPHDAGTARGPRSILRWPISALALVGLAALVVLPWVPLPGVDRDSGAVMRGDVVQTRRAADPAADREVLRAALQAVGIESAPYQRLGRLGLDVDLPRPLTAAQRDALARLGLVTPMGPSLRIEFLEGSGAP